MRSLANYLGFQLVWLLIVLSAANDISVYAIVVTALFAMIQIHFSVWPQADMKLILLGFIVGMLLDTLWLHLGWIDYADSSWTGLAPWWIGCLWISFMLTLNHSLRWLHNQRWLVIIGSLVLAPASYYAGDKLDAVMLIKPWYALMAIAVSWVIALPIAVALAARWRQQEKINDVMD